MSTLSSYSVYTRVGKSNPPLLIQLGDSYKSSSGGAKVAKKAMKQLRKRDQCLRKKQVYVRKHGSPAMKVYKASTRKVKPQIVQIGNQSIIYTMAPSAKYVKTLDSYRVIER